MTLSASEKYEVIRLVEESELSVRRTLNELGVSQSSFYRWYKAYRDNGYEGLVARSKSPRQFWNKLPESVKEQCLEVALEHPELSPRELAWHITDQHEYFISESSVYRLLKQYDLITSPAYILLQAGDKFHTPTKRINELWQTDFTYFKIVGWGWYFLSTVLDDYSRYIISWKLTTTMGADDVKLTLDDAIGRTGADQVVVKHRPRLLSDNGPCYLSKELKEYLKERKMEHTRGAPYHPQTQGKIERYHRSMKNVVKLENYYYPWELEKAIGQFVDYYNHQRYHESLDNVTPADMFYGRYEEIMDRRQLIKQQTLRCRREENLMTCSTY
jgi:transposase InsO family protein|tara:strand:+ start:485 stop:1471 length:987 start_codon:yes stop_codon:yes gene_type:complete